MQFGLRLLELGAARIEFGDTLGAARFEIAKRICQRGFAQARFVVLLGQLGELALEFGALFARANEARFALIDLIFEVAW